MLIQILSYCRQIHGIQSQAVNINECFMAHRINYGWLKQSANHGDIVVR